MECHFLSSIKTQRAHPSTNNNPNSHPPQGAKQPAITLRLQKKVDIQIVAISHIDSTLISFYTKAFMANIMTQGLFILGYITCDFLFLLILIWANHPKEPIKIKLSRGQTCQIDMVFSANRKNWKASKIYNVLHFIGINPTSSVKTTISHIF